MGLVVSLILIAAGAILTWAVNTEPEGLDLDVVGVVLMVVGIVSFILSLLFWSSWGGPGYLRRRTYVGDEPYARRRTYAPRRTRYVEEEDVDVAPPGPPPP